MDGDGRRRPAAEALAEAGIEPLTLRAKEGLALINGTDGILGMLVLAAEDLRSLLRVADLTAAMSVEALLGTDRAFAEDLIALRPQPGQADERRQPAPPARRLADRRQPPRGRSARPGRLLAALRPAGQRRRARRTRLRRPRGGGGAPLRDRQSDGAARRTRRVLRQLPRRAPRPGLRPARDGGRGHRRDRRAADGPAAGRQPLGGPAAVPRRGPGSRFGTDDRPVHAGGDGRRESPAGGSRPGSTRCRRARCRRTTSRWAGEPPGSCERPSTTSVESWRSRRPARRAGLELRAPLEPGAGTGAAVAAIRSAGVPGTRARPPPRPRAGGGGAV